MKNVISTDKAPAAIGPYSQAIEVNNMVYTSGIIPVVPSTGEIPEGSAAQAKQAFENLSNLLEAAGSSMEKVVKTTVFIKEMNDFGAINEAYADFFPAPFPVGQDVRRKQLRWFRVLTLKSAGKDTVFCFDVPIPMINTNDNLLHGFSFPSLPASA